MRQGRTRGRPGRGPPRSRSARSTPTREMRLRTKAPAPRSAHSPSRTAARASPAPAPKDQQAHHDQPDGQAGDVTSRSGRSRLRPGPDRRSGRAERSTPLFPLTLRAMNSGSRHLQTGRSGRPAFALLSVLALLALACFPVLAQAEDSSRARSTKPTVPTGHRDTPPRPTKPPAANDSSTAEGSPTAPVTGRSNGVGSLKRLGRSIAGTAMRKHGPDGGGTGQGNPGNGSPAPASARAASSGQPRQRPAGQLRSPATTALPRPWSRS